ncbi:hypothetical protein [Arthrobacter sp. Br18]|uniref:hypothetical protein n=1 Tax=Arthrobacter sp. Br18 TaxID=1312954 RepID=UPI0004B0E66B|nr:hypothetical protein [Arthrobacter sp. Br18]
MTTQNWPQDPLVPSTTGNQSTAGEFGATGTSGAGNDQSKTSAAKGQAKDVGREGADAAKNVAGTAASEAKNVAGEAAAKAKGLLGDLGDDIKSQAGTQQKRVTEGIRGISDELRSMADKSENPMVSKLVHQVSDRTGSAAGWLEGRDASDILEDVKGFARRKPGMFLGIAAGTGVLVGRLTKGLTGGSSQGSDQSSTTGRSTGTYDTDSYRTNTYVTDTSSTGLGGTGYETGTSRGQHVADAAPAYVDPAVEYPTIPPGTPPVGTLPGERDLR